jgi:ligand-binding sensor domain-containing protein
MNLLVRNNLLFQLIAAPDRRMKLNVKLGAKEYPLADAKNPGTVAHSVRANLTDEKRSLRIYGSQVVVARLTGSGGNVRLHLLNYAGANRKVDGIRVRVLGQYPKHQVWLADGAGVELLDYSVESDATEFTLPELKTYAVVDLSR